MQRGIRGKTDLPSWGYFTDWRNLNWESIDQFLFENWDRLKAAASERGF